MKKKLLTNRQVNEQARTEMIELYELNEKFKRIKQQYETKKEALQTSIKNFMFINGINQANFLANQGSFAKDNKNMGAKMITPCKVIFDADKLEEKLGKEVCKDFIVKECVIADMDGLVKYLKSCGVSPKKFKTFIEVRKQVDAKKIDELSNLGYITQEDIKGCYRLEKGTSYLKINVLKDEE